MLKLSGLSGKILPTLALEFFFCFFNPIISVWHGNKFVEHLYEHKIKQCILVPSSDNVQLGKQTVPDETKVIN